MIKNPNSISNQPKITMGNTELIETNSTKNQYFNHRFGSGFTTILPMRIRAVKFVFHDVDVSGLVLCTILSGDNVKIIDREIIENKQSYKLYKISNLFVIQPASMIDSLFNVSNHFAQKHFHLTTINAR